MPARMRTAAETAAAGADGSHGPVQVPCTQSTHCWCRPSAGAHAGALTQRQLQLLLLAFLAQADALDLLPTQMLAVRV